MQTFNLFLFRSDYYGGDDYDMADAAQDDKKWTADNERAQYDCLDTFQVCLDSSLIHGNFQ